MTVIGKLIGLCQTVPSLEKLIKKVYGHVEAINSHGNVVNLVLSLRNKQAGGINSCILELFPVHYPAELFNNMSVSGC